MAVEGWILLAALVVLIPWAWNWGGKDERDYWIKELVKRGHLYRRSTKSEQLYWRNGGDKCK